MGIRGELFSTRVTCEGRTYFFNVKETRMGDVFLTIVESKPTEADNFERRSIVIFRDDVKDFLKAFQGALGFMEKPGRAAPAIEFDPADSGDAKPRRARNPAGFAGAPRSDESLATRKRRIVVRRKNSGSPSSETPEE